MRALREPTHRLPSCGDYLVDGVQISRLSIKIGAGFRRRLRDRLPIALSFEEEEKVTRRRRRGAPPSPRLRVVRTASGRECPPSICTSRRSGNQAVSTRQERGEEPREGRGEEPREGRGEEPKAASLSLPSHRASLSPSCRQALMHYIKLLAYNVPRGSGW